MNHHTNNMEQMRKCTRVTGHMDTTQVHSSILPGTLKKLTIKIRVGQV